MPSANKNSKGIKGNNNEDRTGAGRKTSTNRKLPHNPLNPPDESISTADDTANGKYSKTKVRKEDRNNADIRGGR